jgi:putative acetyltransferase
VTAPRIRSIQIRLEDPVDVSAIAAVHARAFGRDDEGRIVERLRATASLYLSLVACEGSALLAHIVLAPVTIEAGDPALRLVGLGPMAVAPEHQRKGIGSKLARAGLEACAQRGVDAAFFALELRAGALASVSGLVRYSPAFDAT